MLLSTICIVYNWMLYHIQYAASFNEIGYFIFPALDAFSIDQQGFLNAFSAFSIVVFRNVWIVEFGTFSLLVFVAILAAIEATMAGMRFLSNKKIAAQALARS